ncbi:hypothetical protein R75461_08125 [Paraburkholderia nemoris]|uniref:hypothetical protein n=1 Tax=Paraburkholderia nemoris TaxID=2793076 RepID=UPI00190ACD62|nr:MULTISPECIES: hypothetical protein [Paraburkholderia]MBK3786759.1 hypothetical protein [Paraburkholderia aspalathi]CAE6863636.1 hypothetical protein R75461_08125 [Paraburkholderia nemoris]
MKSRDNVEKMIAYLREHPQPVTITAMVTAGVVAPGEASHAVQYGVRLGVIEHLRRRASRPSERNLYRWTGQPLPPLSAGNDSASVPAGPSFDALLGAWGMATEPPRLPAAGSPRCVSLDD